MANFHTGMEDKYTVYSLLLNTVVKNLLSKIADNDQWKAMFQVISINNKKKWKNTFDIIKVHNVS